MTTLDPASVDLLKYLLNKAQTEETEGALSSFPTFLTSQIDSRELMAVSQLVARIEREDYTCSASEADDLQELMNKLYSRYIEDPETIEQVAGVDVVEGSVNSDEGR